MEEVSRSCYKQHYRLYVTLTLVQCGSVAMTHVTHRFDVWVEVRIGSSWIVLSDCASVSHQDTRAGDFLVGLFGCAFCHMIDCCLTNVKCTYAVVV